MNYKIFRILAIGIFLLAGCGVNNNIAVSTQNGACPTENNAPYCLSVTLQNNSSGQNFINSTNYPINNLILSLSGANNILSPITNKSKMDPNNCTGSSIKPGASCTFYFQLTGESYSITSKETVNIGLNYTLQNNLFGSNTSTGTSSFNVYQYTNLYIMQNNGNLWKYNTLGLTNVGLIESADAPITIATDNTAFGFLFIGGRTGIYIFGNTFTSGSISVSPINGANNLFTLSGNMYATSLSGGYGIWGYSLTNESWLNTNTPSYSFNSLATPNASIVSISSVIYIANSNIVYNCGLTSSNICTAEGTPLINEVAVPAPVTKLAYLTGTNSSVTGLYAGTQLGLFYESSAKTWFKVAQTSGPALSNLITAVATDSNNNLYAGDNLGNIWLVKAISPTTVATYTNSALANPGVTNMIVDKVANLLYFTSYNSANSTSSIYSCTLGTSSCTPTLIGSIGQLGTSPIVGLAIASQLLSQ